MSTFSTFIESNFRFGILNLFLIFITDGQGVRGSSQSWHGRGQLRGGNHWRCRIQRRGGNWRGRGRGRGRGGIYVPQEDQVIIEEVEDEEELVDFN